MESLLIALLLLLLLRLPRLLLRRRHVVFLFLTQVERRICFSRDMARECCLVEGRVQCAPISLLLIKRLISVLLLLTFSCVFALSLPAAMPLLLCCLRTAAPLPVGFVCCNKCDLLGLREAQATSKKLQQQVATATVAPTSLSGELAHAHTHRRHSLLLKEPPMALLQQQNGD